MSKKLVAYFSASGVTAKTAKKVAEAMEADIFEIKPVVAYSNADLNWMDKNSRTTIEKNNSDSRPEISEKCENISEYDTIYLGFPIWWYVAPKIIKTFLESYDFSGKEIVLFATSGGSGFGRTLDDLKTSISSSAVIREGEVLSSSSNVSYIKNALS